MPEKGLCLTQTQDTFMFYSMTYNTSYTLVIFNQGDATFQVGLQKYIIIAVL